MLRVLCFCSQKCATRSFSIKMQTLSVLKNVCRRMSGISNESDTSPLAGIRILDLTRIVAGPYCTMILGDLGAEVIKIEMPGFGDESRKWGPCFADYCTDGCYFLALNRNKKSVCVDLKSASGKDIMHKLATCSDVLVENYVPGKMEEFGLDYESLRKVAPHLVYCSLTGFGSIGPYRKRPGYDVIAASMGGLVHITGPADGEPCKVGVAITDIATACMPMEQYWLRCFTVQNRPWAESGLQFTVNSGVVFDQCWFQLSQCGSSFSPVWHCSREHCTIRSVSTKDGRYLTVGAASDKQFESLCKLLNHSDLAHDPQFCSNRLRVENRAILIPQLRQHFKQKTLAEWLNVFKEAPFPNGPVNSIDQVFSDPHIREIGLVKEVAHASGRTCKVVGPPVVYSESTNAVRMAPPVLGQHTNEVLKQILEYSDEKIDRLRSDNIIS